MARWAAGAPYGGQPPLSFVVLYWFRVAAMKFSQLVVLLVALVLVVFVATFLSQYGGTTRPETVLPPQVGPPPALLTFATTTWPPTTPDAESPPRPMIQEMGKPGHLEFWFENKNEVTVTVGLHRKNCVCTDVSIGLAPEGWTKPPAPEGAAGAEAVHNPPPPAEGVVWRKVEDEVSHPNAGGVDVPPGRGGWARLTWKGDRTGSQMLESELWTQTPERGTAHKLAVGVHFVEPLYIHPQSRELLLDTLNAGDKPKQGSFLVLSATRNAFELQAESEAEQQARHPFVRVAAPERLAGDTLEQVRNRMALPVLSGYRVTVTVSERAPDGRQIDVGPYRAVVRLKSDATETPVEVTVAGQAVGEVTVISEGDTRDRIRLETFPARIGITRKATLEGPPTMKLAVDTVPDFMKVDLKEETAAAPGRRAWSLTVTIAPNAVTGPFPRNDDLLLRDTAIYLKTQSDPPRRIRIPVSGTAALR